MTEPTNETGESWPGLGPIAQIHVSVSNLGRSVSFYRDVLGLEHLFTAPNQPMAFFAAGGVRLYLGVPEDSAFHSRPLIYYRVDDVDATFEAVTGRGAQPLSPPHLVHREVKDGAVKELWMAFVADPDGIPVGFMTERTG
jgi:catechol 2,3-dioxygenase-like lactoylglutathione lyase family enzyme